MHLQRLLAAALAVICRIFLALYSQLLTACLNLLGCTVLELRQQLLATLLTASLSSNVNMLDSVWLNVHIFCGGGCWDQVEVRFLPE